MKTIFEQVALSSGPWNDKTKSSRTHSGPHSPMYQVPHAILKALGVALFVTLCTYSSPIACAQSINAQKESLTGFANTYSQSANSVSLQAIVELGDGFDEFTTGHYHTGATYNYIPGNGSSATISTDNRVYFDVTQGVLNNGGTPTHQFSLAGGAFTYLCESVLRDTINMSLTDGILYDNATPPNAVGYVTGLDDAHVYYDGIVGSAALP